MAQGKVAIIIYSLYHHVYDLALAEKAGIEAAGGVADIYQVAETLSDDVLAKMHAPAKPDIPIATHETLTQYDAFYLVFQPDLVISLLKLKLLG